MKHFKFKYVISHLVASYSGYFLTTFLVEECEENIE